MSTQKFPDLSTADQIAHDLGITTRTLRRWQVEHALPVIEIGKSRRYDARHVQEWLRSRERNAPINAAAA